MEPALAALNRAARHQRTPELGASGAHRIWLARHLPSAHTANARITAAEFGAWSLQYDAAGLVDGAAPSAELTELAARCRVLSSPLSRAVRTATLAHGGAPTVVPVLARAIRPDVRLPLLRLRPWTWRALTRVVWRTGWSPATETPAQAQQRAAEAARLLAVAALDAELLVVGHNYFNSLIADALTFRGWSGPRKPTSRLGGATAYLPPRLNRARAGRRADPARLAAPRHRHAQPLAVANQRSSVPAAAPESTASVARTNPVRSASVTSPPRPE